MATPVFTPGNRLQINDNRRHRVRHVCYAPVVRFDDVRFDHARRYVYCVRVPVVETRIGRSQPMQVLITIQT